ncbi:MAG: hypothetical protein K2Q10_02795 [Rhodospirillales bacterium]|nr:hypothetical protein [Rhodospirillales bacterium]
MNDKLMDDVAHASAAYCLNCVLPKLKYLTVSEQFDLLKACFQANLAAYRDCTRGWLIPDPSVN